MMPGPRLSDVKILLVEGHPALREAVREYLSIQGAQVKAFKDPRDALAVVATFSPHLVLCEIKIATEEAFELLEEIHRIANETDPRIIAVGLSLLSGSTIESRALSAGFHAVLQKPFGPADLLQLLCRLLSR